jgi:hypothetical protein
MITLRKIGDHQYRHEATGVFVSRTFYGSERCWEIFVGVGKAAVLARTLTDAREFIGDMIEAIDQ